MDVVIKVDPVHMNIAPIGFHLWATHYLKCRKDFKPPSPDSFSPVPYFLLCRAIELEIKARLLKKITQKDAKYIYGHNLAKAYDALESSEKILNQDEEDTLRMASPIYDKKDKGFEYIHINDALTAYRRFPNLGLLDSIASKLIDNK